MNSLNQEMYFYKGTESLLCTCCVPFPNTPDGFFSWMLLSHASPSPVWCHSSPFRVGCLYKNNSLRTYSEKHYPKAKQFLLDTEVWQELLVETPLRDPCTFSWQHCLHQHFTPPPVSPAEDPGECRKSMDLFGHHFFPLPWGTCSFHLPHLPITCAPTENRLGQALGHILCLSEGIISQIKTLNVFPVCKLSW